MKKNKKNSEGEEVEDYSKSPYKDAQPDRLDRIRRMFMNDRAVLGIPTEGRTDPKYEGALPDWVIERAVNIVVNRRVRTEAQERKNDIRNLRRGSKGAGKK